MGDVVFIGVPGEMHSPFQLEMRKHFSDNTIVIMNMVNGNFAYLPPKNDYPMKTYQSSISPFEPGCHERVLADCKKIVAELLAEDTALHDQTKGPRRTKRSGNVSTH